MSQGRGRAVVTTDRIRVWGRFASMVVLACCGSSVTLAQGRNGSASPQEMLDLLAKPPAAKDLAALPPEYPKRYADWTEAQQKSGLQMVAQRCGLLVALVHDNPSARILPEPMTKLEESQLGFYVCAVGRMPADWTERSRYLDLARVLLAKAAKDGVFLRLPATLLQ